jgi:DNA-directed RNA polymerase subunit alpha
LRRANIKTLGDLVRRSEQDMLKYRNFGKQSLKEISEILSGMDLHLGMDVDAILGGAGAGASGGEKKEAPAKDEEKTEEKAEAL